MSHKVHPKIFRIMETGEWASRWLNLKEMPFLLREDFLIREFLEKKLKDSSLEDIQIERSRGKLNIIVSTARPGLVIGRGGAGIEETKSQLFKLLLKEKIKPQEIRLEIREIKNPWESASLTAQWIASQLERRMPFRRVMKQTLSKVMAVKGIQGAKIEISGRLGGSEIARREWQKQGRLPLQTLRANIDYALKEAFTTYGTIGVKVWMYKGERT